MSLLEEARSIANQCIADKLEEVQVPGDGNCLFLAIDRGLVDLGILEGNPRILGHLRTREAAAWYIQSHPNQFHLGESTPEAYCAEIRGTKWGGENEVRALSKHFSVVIWVIHDGLPLPYGREYEAIGLVIYLAYYRRRAHYNYLRKK